MYRFKLFILLVVCSTAMFGQDDLMALLDENPTETPDAVTATFKGTRLVNGHTVEIRAPKTLEFLISHRFGRVSDGSYGFWGLDGASIRLGLDYVLVKNLSVGVGRSSYQKTFDSYLKYRLLSQTNQMPVAVTAFGSLSFTTDSTLNYSERSYRSNYTGQLLIARKFSSSFSLQLMPTIIQRNLVPTPEDDNLLIAIGVGGRLKLSNRVSLNLEYYPQISDYNNTRYDAFAVGFDIETGGHVFQLHLTNAQQMNEKGFIGETSEDFFGDGIHFGFNISRAFQLGNKKSW